MAEARLVDLERKVNLVMKGLNLLLFQEGEAVSEDEAKELKARLEDYLKGAGSEFVPLDELPSHVKGTRTQEGPEGDRRVADRG